MMTSPVAALRRLSNDPELRQLLLLDRRSFAVAHERASLIVSRVQVLAIFLAGLTLAWIIVDYADFDFPLWRAIALERCLAGIAFLGLARFRFTRCRTRPELVALAILFAVPLCFLVATELTFALFDVVGSPIAGATAYYFLPFIVAAGLAIFPLTAVESAGCAIPILASMVVSISIWPTMLGPIPALETLWRLLVISGICGYAGICQLRLLISVTERASRDGMTGALTRQAGELLLEMEIARASRYDTPLAVVFIDLDHFKLVNDRFGHEAGDAVLRRAAERMKATLRRQDALVRWGGEEFLLVLGDTTSEDAAAVIERLGAIGLGDLPDGAAQTASLGLAERIADKRHDTASLVALADERMYAAKQAGRNRWINCAGTAKAFCRTPVTLEGLARRSTGRDLTPRPADPGR